MARPKSDFETLLARFPPETKARIDAVLVKPETRADFVRVATAKELKRRERQK